MLKDTLKTIINRDLNRLKDELLLYKNEEDIWIIKSSINNSAGNLCLHLIGNLNTYIGKELGKIEYIRNRELEFSLKNIPRNELIRKIEQTEVIINQTLEIFDYSLLETDFPILLFDHKTSIEYVLVHLVSHLTYHLGQINYHRRMI